MTSKFEKEQKYKKLFCESKKIIKQWENEFYKENLMTPSKMHIKNASENVQLCYKNCWKIKKYFDAIKNENIDSSKSFSDTFKDDLNISSFGCKEEVQSEKSHVTSKSYFNREQSCTSVQVWDEKLNCSEPVVERNKDHDKLRMSYLGISNKLSENFTAEVRMSLKKKSKRSIPLTKFSPAKNKYIKEEHISLDVVSHRSDTSSYDERSDVSIDSINIPLPSESKFTKVLPPNNVQTKPINLFSNFQSNNTITESRTIFNLDKDWLNRVNENCKEFGSNTEKNSPLKEVNLTNAKDTIVYSQDNGANPNANTVEFSIINQSNLANVNFDNVEKNVQNNTELELQNDISEQRVPYQPTSPVIQKRKKLNCNLNSRRKVGLKRKEIDGICEEDKHEKRQKLDLKEYSCEKSEIDDENLSRQNKEVNKKPKLRKSKKNCNAKTEENILEPEEPSVNGREVSEKSLKLLTLGFEDYDESLEFAKSSKFSKTLQFKSGESIKTNENYRKINLKKKVFVRGKKNITGGKIKRQNWKNLKSKLDQKSGTCFKCGESGHWARDCLASMSDKLKPIECDKAICEFPTLQEAATLASGISGKNTAFSTNSIIKASVDEGGLTENYTNLFEEILKHDDSLLESETPVNESQNNSETTGNTEFFSVVESYFSANDGESLPDCPGVVKETLKLFGHDSFRPGQLEAITRILAGKSTLVLLSTGAGKSLIYQLPAYLMGEKERCITLVISPLVSLMEDQILGLPPFLKAACYHCNLTKVMKHKVIERIKNDNLHFLLISPETLASGGGTFRTLVQNLPPIAFVCIDEAHCVSQWSHNFRPAYLKICKIIREKFGIKTILGLTATAPETTVQSIAGHLRVDEPDGIIKGKLLPSNLNLSVSKDEDRDFALVQLLKGGRFKNCDSIIIYCTRRDECSRIAVMIRTILQDTKLDDRKYKRGQLSTISEAYHAGLTASKRRTIQKHFMSGNLKIVVATVAFGMGIDKSDIRAVIHYNMPKSFESYIQEIGRAGRDGLPAHCHLFLNSEGKDLNEIRRHIYSNSVDRFTLRKLLQKIFKKSQYKSLDCLNIIKNEYREVALSITDTVQLLDLPEENISTLMCYLEDHPKKWIKLESPVFSKCKIQTYSGLNYLKYSAKKCAALGAAIALQIEKGDNLEKTSFVEFPVVEVASIMGWDSGVVKRELKSLEWNNISGSWQRSPLLVEFSDLAFHLYVRRSLSDEELDEILDVLSGRVNEQEQSELYNLKRLFRSFSIVSHKSCDQCSEKVDAAMSEKLKGFILEYFSENERKAYVNDLVTTCPNEDQVRRDVRTFINMQQDFVWTGRAVARIFHGIPSPNFPSIIWSKQRRYWRSHLDVDFNFLCKLANQEILSMK